MRKLDEWELADLARYNAEKARGLKHTDDWAFRMDNLQVRFNTVQELEACGITAEEDE